MVDITSDLIKAIREKTGAGMMDCKKALVEANGDIDSAIDWLRKKGLAAVARRAGKIAAEGLVCIASRDNTHKDAIVLEVNSETDFVAKNAQFQEFAVAICKIALEKGHCTIAELLAQEIAQETTVEAGVTSLAASTGENITVRRLERVTAQDGIVATYIHSAVAEGLGKIGVLVSIESTGDAAKLLDFGKKLAMHIAASNPKYLSISDVPAAVVDYEKQVLFEQLKGQNKPQDVMNKMVDGKIRKFYEETVLLEQVYVMDGKKKIADVISDFAKELGTPVVVPRFVKFVLGDGIEKVTSNFCEDVKALQ
jgi:elongation factor Ts